MKEISSKRDKKKYRTNQACLTTTKC